MATKQWLYRCSVCNQDFPADPPKHKVGDRVWVASKRAYGRITAVRPPRCSRCEADPVGVTQDDLEKAPDAN